MILSKKCEKNTLSMRQHWISTLNIDYNLLIVVTAHIIILIHNVLYDLLNKP